MNFHRNKMVIVHTRNELKEMLRQATSAYNKELHSNGLTGKLEDIEKQKDSLKSQISKGIYL